MKKYIAQEFTEDGVPEEIIFDSDDGDYTVQEFLHIYQDFFETGAYKLFEIDVDADTEREIKMRQILTIAAEKETSYEVSNLQTMTVGELTNALRGLNQDMEVYLFRNAGFYSSEIFGEFSDYTIKSPFIDQDGRIINE